MRTYLVTGGAGFIGSHLVEALVSRGDRVRILDNLTTSRRENLPSRAEFIQGDVTDPKAVARGLERVDGCFHLAGVSSVEQGDRDWLGTHRINLGGTIAIFDGARQAAGRPIPVVYASSAAVYGDTGELPLNEKAPLRPISAYGVDKLSGELHAAIVAQAHQFQVTGLRFFNVYGPRQDPQSPYVGVISKVIAHFRRHETITVFGDGEQTRDFVYVGDAVCALLAAMSRTSSEPAVFNVCSGHATSINTLVQLMGRILGVEPRIDFATMRAGDIRASCGDPQSAEALLGFSARTSLAIGLERMLSVAPTSLGGDL